MSTPVLLFTLLASFLVLSLPRRYAAIPLLLTALYLGIGQVLDLGVANFTGFRIVVGVGIIRVLARGERLANGVNSVDRTLLLWAAWLMASTVFHTSNNWVLRAGVIWGELGCYLLFRVFVQDLDDVQRMFKVICVALVPVAISMFVEKYAGTNFLAVMGGYDEIVVRNEVVRARGTFVHPILAGTVGATGFLMALYLWRTHRTYALAGLFGATGVVVASASSGPVMMVLFSLFGLALWKARTHMRGIRWFVLTAIIALDLVMKDPVYFLMARIDLAGGSTGWHRARLIQSAFEHWEEWWLTGTDYTRHWMPTGIHANEIHTDITNHLLGMGVMGGYPLMIIFLFVLVAAFRRVGRGLQEKPSTSEQDSFLIWTIGSILFGHVMNFFSISLFDQSVVYLYFVLAAIGAIKTDTNSARAPAIDDARNLHPRPTKGHQQWREI